MNSNVVYCSQCGHQNVAEAKFCSHCGAELTQPQQSSAPTQFSPLPQPPPAPQQPVESHAAPPAFTPPPQAAPPPPAYAPPQSPPPYAAQPAPPRKSKSGFRTCAILLVVMICLCGGLGAAGWYFGDKVVDLVKQQFPDVGELLQSLLGDEIDEELFDTILGGETTGSVTSSLAGEVSSDNGASIKIPAGSVPPMEDGSAGTMVFSIEVDSSITPDLPGGYEPVGPIYSLGPDGFVFSMPIELILPIPEDVDPALVIGFTYYDPADDSWKLLPGTIDATARTASTNVSHLSHWGLFGRCIFNTFGGCEYYEARHDWHREHGGWIKVVNTHIYNTGSYPGGRHQGVSTTYGVCIQSYAFQNEDEDALNWLAPLNWKIMAYNDSTSSYWMPSGRYDLIEFISLSEVNNDPLYIPDYTTYWRSIGSYTITPDDTIEFSSSNVDINDGTFTESRPPCWGEMDTSVGTGDVQVTLTWQTNDDIDLYVTDPDGETISYQNTWSYSGGQLDRDNLCGNLIIGRPENIFWPEGGAPSGTYTVQVNYFGACESAHSVNWTVRVILMGNVQTYTGTLTEEYETQDVTTFTVP
jgi:hypothetical protein